MLSREAYMSMQQAVMEKRVPQLRRLFRILRKHISLGDRVVSIGCGTAAEFRILPHGWKVGIDHNPSIVDFCRTTHEATFHQGNYMDVLDELPDGSVDLLLALDIDTNIVPKTLVRQAKSKLASGGAIIITEREGNVLLYGRSLLLPAIKGLDGTLLTRCHQIPQPDDRDNLVFIVRS